MATKGPRRGHRRRHTKPKRASRSELIPPGPTSVHHIPDNLLELVLLRMGSSLTLLRAAFTCRIIADDPAFLIRFRSLHGPHVPAHYHIIDPSYDKLPPDGNNQVFLPDTSTADALNRRNFSLDFLPDLDWELDDSRGGLLLLYRRNFRWHQRQVELQFPDMIVSDPLTRRYQGSSTGRRCPPAGASAFFLLNDIAADDTGSSYISMSNFRVVAVVPASPVFACVFSSGSDSGWRESATIIAVAIPEFHLISFVGRARSSLYWHMEGEGVLLALDETTVAVDFSLVTFPYPVVGMPDDSSTFRVICGHDVEGTELRVVLINNGDLTVFAQVQGSDEWVAEKLVRLPEATCGLPRRWETFFQRPAKIVAANTRYILMMPREENWIVSVDLHS